jgi:hypothetical protein
MLVVMTVWNGTGARERSSRRTERLRTDVTCGSVARLRDGAVRIAASDAWTRRSPTLDDWR